MGEVIKRYLISIPQDKKEPTGSGGCGTVSNIQAAGSNESTANSSGQSPKIYNSMSK